MGNGQMDGRMVWRLRASDSALLSNRAAHPGQGNRPSPLSHPVYREPALLCLTVHHPLSDFCFSLISAEPRPSSRTHRYHAVVALLPRLPVFRPLFVMVAVTRDFWTRGLLY